MSNNNNIQTLLLEVLSDTRLQALIESWVKLSTRKKRLLLRITRGLI